MRPARLVRRAARLAAVGLLATVAVQALPAPARATVPVPATPASLPSGVEDLQAYVGQTLCDPVAKPGVAAFRSLVLRTYSGTTDLGVIRDCGQGGQSEHKEGRAWDWGVSVSNATQKAQADGLLAWLLKTDAQGHTYAMARRFGIMYMIWNHRIWKAYQADKGWQSYSGTNPHTDHVHFSFGWSGAKKATSYWTGSVAAFDPGPAAPVVPVPSPANLALVRTYGGLVLRSGATGAAVATVQRPMRLVVTSSYGTQTVGAVQRFQQQQGLAVTGTFGATEWKALFPPPVIPFGAVDAAVAVPGGTRIAGWAIDADTSASLPVTVTLDGAQVATTTASLERPDVALAYPGFGTAHGFAATLTVPEGAHQVCATAANAPGTPGSDGALTCRTVVVTHLPGGAVETATEVLGRISVAGWALDPDTAEPVRVAVSLDGAAPAAVPADGDRPDVAALWPGWGAAHGFTAQLDAAEGPHQVCVTALNAGMGADASLGCRTVTVRHAADGALTTLGLRPGGVLAAGWGLDPDVAAAVPVALTVDGTPHEPLTADKVRTDVPAGYAANGTAHGFAALLPLAEGPHTVCASAANASGTPGADQQLGCRTVTAQHGAQGGIDAVRPLPGGGLAVTAWALDPDVAGSTSVQLRVDGGAARTFTAKGARADVATRWPGYGSAHGFSTTLSLAAGPHQVCLTALNAPRTAGRNTALGCRWVLLGSPSGQRDPVRVGAGRAVVSGWVLDPDVSRAAGWQVRVDGTLVARGAADVARTGFGKAHPGYGDKHGFRAGLALRRGSHKVCVTAVNVSGTRGGNRSLGCSTVTVP
jgi:peptidoglycan hydrolase-like protein with peptidoglycan-binding domain